MHKNTFKDLPQEAAQIKWEIYDAKTNMKIENGVNNIGGQSGTVNSKHNFINPPAASMYTIARIYNKDGAEMISTKSKNYP